MQDTGNTRKSAHRRIRDSEPLAALLPALLVVLGCRWRRVRRGLGRHALGPADVCRTGRRGGGRPRCSIGNTRVAIPHESSWGDPPITKALQSPCPGDEDSHRPPPPATAPYPIGATFLTRMRQVVDWARTDALHVVLNVHHDSWQWIAILPTDHDQVLAHFRAAWSQICTAFRDEPHTPLLESVNEPQFNNATDVQKSELLNELNTQRGRRPHVHLHGTDDPRPDGQGPQAMDHALQSTTRRVPDRVRGTPDPEQQLAINNQDQPSNRHPPARDVPAEILSNPGQLTWPNSKSSTGQGRCLVTASAQYQAVQARSWPSQASTALETRPLRLLPICV